MFKLLKLLVFRKRWRRLNEHNFTAAKNIFNISKVVVGNNSYGALEVYSWLNNNDKLYIGSYVSISSDVKFIIDGNHNTSYLTTFPFEAILFDEITDSNVVGKGSISIGDDVWIGMNSMILSGVNVGQGAVIGAGSVVAKDIPPYAIVAGNPAKIVKYRFPQGIVEKLIKLDFKKIDKDFVKNNLSLFYRDVDNNLLKTIEEAMNK
jgi:acetyltransferase-like isoleucine patch superfamily enzyme